MINRVVKSDKAVLAGLVLCLPFCIGLCIGDAAAEAPKKPIVLKGNDFVCEVWSAPVKLQCVVANDTPKTKTFASAKAERISDPERFFIDFPGFSVSKTFITTVPDSELISAVRIGSPQKGSARIVMDLKANLSYQFKLSPNAKRVSVEFAFVGPSPEPTPGEPEEIEAKYTAAPSPSDTARPTPKPTATETPTLKPTPKPSEEPTESPTAKPSREPSASPTRKLTPPPTERPSPTLTLKPTETPKPSGTPTLSPSVSPSATKTPTRSPSPTRTPTPEPTRSPTPKPTPTPSPTRSPKPSPTLSPTRSQSPSPTESPTRSPSKAPTDSPTPKPTYSLSPSPSLSPSASPTRSLAPTKEPTPSQTNAPKPSATLTPAPTKGPTETPTPPLGKRPQIQLSLPASELQPEKVLLFAVDKSFIEFEPGERPIKDVKVFNKTDQQVVLYSKVEAVTSPGTAEEAFAPSDKLLVSPKRLPIEALGSAAIRLVALEDAGARPDEGEYTYRISLFPQEGAPKTVEAKVNEAPHKINVVAGLAITAVLPAADAAADISFSFSKEEVIFSNSGSRTAALENCAKCPMTSAECSSLPRRLVAPKSSISLPISGRGIITCDVRTGADFKKINAQYGAMEVK